MSAVGRFTLASLKANKVRTAVTVAGVALAAALLCAVLTTYTSLTNYLCQQEAALSGTWSAMAQQPDSPHLQERIAAAEEARDVAGLATMADVGFGELTEAQRTRFGPYLPVLSAAGDLETTCAVVPSAGRMPEASDEVMLWETWQQEGIELGDVLELQVGQRAAVLAAGQEGTMTHMEAPADFASIAEEDDLDAFTAEIAEGTLLDSSIGYLDAEADGGIFDERLVDTEPRRFTVVGFYDRGNRALMSGIAPAAVTAEAASGTSLMSVYLTLEGQATQDQVMERAQELFPDAAITPHTALLRFQGIVGKGAIWDTFFGLAAILAAVIVAACMALIYNSFAISVAERTNQFGLLSSVGASRRQLRRAVLLEALLVAVAGLPLGILVGLGGCAVTFAALEPAILDVLGDAAGVPFAVSVEPWVLAAVLALTLVTVLFSAWLPAARASRLNIIDALRQTKGGRVTKQGVRRAARATDAKKLWKRGTGAGRVLGIGGKLAAINRKRGSTKGTAAAVSLALAIVLLMTAGSLSTFLGKLTDAADQGVDFDIGLFVQPAGDQDAALGELADAAALDELTSAFDASAATPEAQLVGWNVYGSMPAIMADSLAGSGLVEGVAGGSGRVGEGEVGAYASVRFLDDEAFAEYAQQLGIDLSAFNDTAAPKAIAVATAYGNDGTRYQSQQLMRNTGPVQLWVGGSYGEQPIDYFTYQWVAREDATEDDAQPFIEFLPGIGASERNQFIEDLDDPALSIEAVTIEVAALADEPPVSVQESGSLQLIMPQSAITAFANATVPGFAMGAYDAAAGSSERAAEAIEDAVESHLAQTGVGSRFLFFTNDYAATANTNRMLATIVNVFCLLFAVILAVIALTNVFNAVANSLILRRREFAVMQSVGMSGRQFRRLIASECAAFGIAGLVPGLIISAVIAWLMHAVIGESLEGLAFALPWSYVALAIGLTAAAMALSVAFALHRCKSQNIVEALRADNI